MADQILISGAAEETVEDGGYALILRVDPPGETGPFFRLQSWDETKAHEDLASFRGKEITGLFSVGQLKVHVLQMEHWYHGGPIVRVFATHEAAEAAAIALFNETMLEDLNWRATEHGGLKARKPVTDVKTLYRVIDWANDEFDWSADCQITTVNLEGV